MKQLCYTGILKEGFSAYSSLVMLISRKLTKDKRVVTDLRHLNVRITKNNLAHPLVRDTFSKCGVLLELWSINSHQAIIDRNISTYLLNISLQEQHPLNNFLNYLIHKSRIRVQKHHYSKHKYPIIKRRTRYTSIRCQVKVSNEPEKILISSRCQLITCFINISKV